MYKITQFFWVLVCLLFIISCQKDSEFIGPANPETDRTLKSLGSEINPETVLDEINVALTAQGVNYRAAVGEFLGSGESNHMGITVVAKDMGNKQLDHDFVPFDPRRVPWSGAVDGDTDNITYAVDQTTDAAPLLGGVSAADATAAIDAAMTSWENVNCSDLSILKNPDFGLDIGVAAFQLSGGLVGSPFGLADVQHAGFRDLNFADGVIGATFTFLYIDGSGNFTDIDNNGKLDVALREIYYDPSWVWGIGSDVDIESVALHEAGHGLSQAHFGTIKIMNKGSVHASPRAVMNAVYLGPLTNLQETDNGGHCSNWSQWPNN